MLATTSGNSIVQRAEIVNDDEAACPDSSWPEWSCGAQSIAERCMVATD